jgi:hypothetical protein
MLGRHDRDLLGATIVKVRTGCCRVFVGVRPEPGAGACAVANANPQSLFHPHTHSLNHRRVTAAPWCSLGTAKCEPWVRCGRAGRTAHPTSGLWSTTAVLGQWGRQAPTLASRPPSAVEPPWTRLRLQRRPWPQAPVVPPTSEPSMPCRRRPDTWRPLGPRVAWTGRPPRPAPPPLGPPWEEALAVLSLVPLLLPPALLPLGLVGPRGGPTLQLQQLPLGCGSATRGRVRPVRRWLRPAAVADHRAVVGRWWLPRGLGTQRVHHPPTTTGVGPMVVVAVGVALLARGGSPVQVQGPPVGPAFHGLNGAMGAWDPRPMMQLPGE